MEVNMATPKVMGIETEYGVIIKGGEEHSPILASSVLINSYASPRLKRVLWDYEEENPLRDARGFERAGLDPIEEDTGLVSVILENGARYYVDHAHPEYSTPECTNALDLVIHDKAGERVLDISMQRALRAMGGAEIIVYKNNSDRKGNSYGCHENYLMSRSTSFPSIVSHLTPFLVTRQIYTGAGKVGVEASGASDRVDYQISQRADFFEVEVGLETTFKRPIINTRDEPHADPDKYRRLHVIIGDANLSEVATFLKVGTTALVLEMIEDGFITADLSLLEPVSALRSISHDPTCRMAVARSDGKTATAIEMQWEFLDWAKKYLTDKEVPEVTAQVVDLWEQVLSGLELDPMSQSSRLDWVAKLRLLEAYRDRHGLGWDHPKVAMVDLQYADVRASKGLYHKLAQQGRMERLVRDEDIERAVTTPPEDTRAWFRGNVLRRFSSEITAASWDGIVFDIGTEALRKVPMPEPLKGTKEGTDELIESSESAAELLDGLEGTSAG